MRLNTKNKKCIEYINMSLIDYGFTNVNIKTIKTDDDDFIKVEKHKRKICH